MRPTNHEPSPPLHVTMSVEPFMSLSAAAWYPIDTAIADIKSRSLPPRYKKEGGTREGGKSGFSTIQQPHFDIGDGIFSGLKRAATGRDVGM